jgi:hypothetical protein
MGYKTLCPPVIALHQSRRSSASAAELEKPDRWAKTGTIIAYELQCSERITADIRALESQTAFLGLGDFSALALRGFTGSPMDRCAKRGWAKKMKMFLSDFIPA